METISSERTNLFLFRSFFYAPWRPSLVHFIFCSVISMAEAGKVQTLVLPFLFFCSDVVIKVGDLFKFENHGPMLYYDGFS